EPTHSILVIEDDPAHAEAMRRALSTVAHRYNVRVLESLNEARQALAEGAPDLVLADLHLADGISLELLPAPGEHARLPLLVLTSHGDERTAVAAIRAGALDYVVKSAETFRDLPRIIERALREWRLTVERSTTQRALEESVERFRVLFSAAPDAFFLFARGGQLLDCNVAAETMIGETRVELLGRSAETLGFPPGGGPEPQRLSLARAGAEPREVELRTSPVQLDGHPVWFVTVRDVSARVRSERAQRRLEEQLHQAAKMDAIGRLAGGIAHDFNNMLTAISGYAELLLYDEAPGSLRAPSLNEILNAARSASSLTSQLLAFSRKQLIEPLVLDLNAQVERNTRMLERLIGEDVALSFAPGAGPLRVKMDPNQLQQVLINLAVNARDAMPKGGQLRVRTDSAQVEAEERAARLGLASPEATPNEFVRLIVEDDGTGMSADTLARLFEPFFTTKERSRGTGLGLSIIYGIVKQNGGFIVVSSELGTGSRFEIYLPRVWDGVAEPSDPPAAQRGPRGNARVLLVEDEDAVRAVTTRFLEHAGYRVTAVSRGSEALAIVRARPRFDLLVTDVVLPEQNGRKVYEELRELLPALRVLYISGYDEDVIARHGVLDPSIHFLPKPFSQEQLARKVEEALR
ncbi:MAG TPA: response regulator, partial [Polyangiales bacterium]|nr:response regulator [Polyangiales bacterium]